MSTAAVSGESSTAETQREQHLQELGITELPNGHYRLPPVIIRHSDGEMQSLVIDVGDAISAISADPEGGNAIDNQRVMTLQQFLSSFTRPGADSATIASNTSDLPTSTEEENRSRSVSTQNAVTQQLPVLDTTAANNSTTTAADTRADQNDDVNNVQHAGIRGLDYPAFDVSREGVYNETSQPAGVLGPIQHILNAISARRSPTNPVAHTLPAPGLSFPIINNGSDQESRNIILTVNYVYGGQQGPNSSTTGSLILHVPSINESNQDNIEVLVRLATSIALRTISSTVKKSWGVSKDTFNHLKIKKLSELGEHDSECPICYDKFVNVNEEEEEETRESSKRKRDDEEMTDDDHSNDDQQTNKRAKSHPTTEGVTNNGAAASEPAPPLAASALEALVTENTSAPDLKKPKPVIVNPSEYPHVPVELTCGHIFGQSCLAEWFKTSSSCPLCRSKLPTIGGGNSTQTTITLPNLATVIRNGREVIDNFNHRHLSITVPEEANNQNATTAGQETFDNNNTNTLFVNNTERLGMGLGMGITSLNNHLPSTATAADLTNDNHATATTTPTDSNANSSTRTNDSGSNGLDALASILRDVYNTVAERFGIARPEDEAATNNAELNNDVMEIRFGRSGTVMNPIRAGRPASGFRFYRNVNRDRVTGPPPSGGLFPSGVVSSRSRPGGPVETREIHQNEDLLGDRERNDNNEQNQE